MIETNNGNIVSESADKTIKIWDQNGNCLNTLNHHLNRVYCLFPKMNGEFMSGSQDHTIKIWKEDGNLLQTLQSHSGVVRDLIETSAGYIVSLLPMIKR